MFAFFLFVLSCVGSGLTTGWSLVQGVLPTVYKCKITEPHKEEAKARYGPQSHIRRRRCIEISILKVPGYFLCRRTNSPSDGGFSLFSWDCPGNVRTRPRLLSFVLRNFTFCCFLLDAIWVKSWSYLAQFNKVTIMTLLPTFINIYQFLRSCLRDRQTDDISLVTLTGIIVLLWVGCKHTSHFVSPLGAQWNWLITTAGIVRWYSAFLVILQVPCIK
jgi:hypothetical protein